MCSRKHDNRVLVPRSASGMRLGSKSWAVVGKLRNSERGVLAVGESRDRFTLCEEVVWVLLIVAAVCFTGLWLIPYGRAFRAQNLLVHLAEEELQK